MAASGGDEIRHVVRVTAQDVVAGNLLWARRFQFSRGSLIFSGLYGLVFGLVWLLVTPGPVAAKLPAAAGLALAVTLGFKLFIYVGNLLYMPFMARRAYREQAALHRPVEILATPDSLTVAQPDLFVRMRWSELLRWCEDGRALILFYNRVSFYILPKRDFDEAEIARIRGWLTAAKVPRY